MRSDQQGVTFCWLKMAKLKTFKQYFKRYYVIFVLQFWKKNETLRYVQKNSFEYSVRDVRITGTTKYSVSFSSLSLSFRFSLQDLEKSDFKSHHNRIFLNLGHLLVCLRKKTSFTAPWTAIVIFKFKLKGISQYVSQKKKKHQLVTASFSYKREGREEEEANKQRKGGKTNNNKKGRKVRGRSLTWLQGAFLRRNETRQHLVPVCVWRRRVLLTNKMINEMMSIFKIFW